MQDLTLFLLTAGRSESPEHELHFVAVRGLELGQCRHYVAMQDLTPPTKRLCARIALFCLEKLLQEAPFVSDPISAQRYALQRRPQDAREDLFMKQLVVVAALAAMMLTPAGAVPPETSRGRSR